MASFLEIRIFFGKTLISPKSANLSKLTLPIITLALIERFNGDFDYGDVSRAA